ncbi:MAG: 1-acyl-sn-glycerol-3-phosphate acyltransferase [Fermentimonas sp.]|jgi:putative hemolysin
MSRNENFRIDIDSILKDKAPNSYKKIPGFVIRYLKKIVHQDEMNAILERISDKDGIDFMKALIDDEFNIKLNIEGEENIPDSGRFTFVSNHPLGGLDGICLSTILGEKYDGKIKYLVNDILYYIDPLKSIFIPINKHGAQAKNSAIKINEAYASDNQIITFPAGLCSRKQSGKIVDLDWLKNFVSKSIEYGRDIVPIYFSGKNSNFFYNLANLRKRLGIKFNLEMVYLPDEMFKNKNQTFTVKFGRPISYKTLDSSKSPTEWADHIKKIVYSME